MIAAEGIKASRDQGIKGQTVQTGSDAVARIVLDDRSRCCATVGDLVEVLRLLEHELAGAMTGRKERERVERDARLRLGRALIQAKAQVPHGRWREVYGSLRGNERTLQACMRSAEQFSDESGNFDLSKVAAAQRLVVQKFVGVAPPAFATKEPLDLTSYDLRLLSRVPGVVSNTSARSDLKLNEVAGLARVPFGPPSDFVVDLDDINVGGVELSDGDDSEYEDEDELVVDSGHRGIEASGHQGSDGFVGDLGTLDDAIEATERRRAGGGWVAAEQLSLSMMYSEANSEFASLVEKAREIGGSAYEEAQELVANVRTQCRGWLDRHSPGSVNSVPSVLKSAVFGGGVGGGGVGGGA